MYKNIKELLINDIVLFIDAYDVLVLATKEQILNRFLTMSTPFVISVERYCFSYSDRAKDFPQGPTSFRYINSGSYIGYVHHLNKIFNDLSPISRNQDDQGLLTLHYFDHPEMYTFDCYCELFMPLAGVIKGEINVDELSCCVYCAKTGSQPCFIHGNGGSRPLYQENYDILFLNNPLWNSRSLYTGLGQECNFGLSETKPN